MRFIIGWLVGTVLLNGFLLVTALVFNAPLLVAARLARRRLRPIVPKLVVGLGFAIACGYWHWEMEWFDVWRHGVPPATYIILNYLPYIVVFAAVGWFTGGFVVRERRKATV